MRSRFLLGLLLWVAVSANGQQFIGCRQGDSWAETPMLRTTFHIDHGELRHSDLQTVVFQVSVVSLGYHEVYVNDTKVGDYVMQPAVSQLDKRALWVEYDITSYLHEGDNELMLWLGQGWGRIYGTPAAVQATVRKSVSDGECGLIYEILKTDSTWDASASPYSYTGNWQPMQFGGERYDARVKESWRPASVYEAEGIAVSRQQFEGNRIVDTVKFQAFEVLPDGGILLDFGRVVTGCFAAFFVPCYTDTIDDAPAALPAGTEVSIEYLDHRDAKPPHIETDIFVSDGNGKDLFRNRFHTHSFRYVRVKGASVVYARALQISAVDPAGGATFECSDPRLNAIHDMVKYTLSCLTFSGYMVDCPHIERMGYGGDGNSSTNTLQTLWDVRDVYANWMQAWHDALDSTGDLPYVAPSFRTGGGPYWQGFIVKAPWRTYLNYGDPTLIYRHYDDMCRWMDYIERHSVDADCDRSGANGNQSDGILQPWGDTEQHSWFLADWAVPEGVDKGGESVLHASSCFIAECLGDMERMARMTGHLDDVKRFAERRQLVVDAIHRHFYHVDTVAGETPAHPRYANGTPLDMAYALLMGVPPDSATAAAVKAQLIRDIHGRYRDHVAFGLMGTPVFTEWCIRERQADLMATLLRQPDYPGYLYMIDHGATTTWESWDCGRPGKEDRSRVHNCYNGIGIWFYQALAGIRPDPEQPGYKHFFVDPQPCNGIEWVRATKPTPYGTIGIEITGSKLKLTVPENTTATVFPNTFHERTLPAGEWTLSL